MFWLLIYRQLQSILYFANNVTNLHIYEFHFVCRCPHRSILGFRSLLVFYRGQLVERMLVFVTANVNLQVSLKDVSRFSSLIDLLKVLSEFFSKQTLVITGLALVQELFLVFVTRRGYVLSNSHSQILKVGGV